ncbi:MAG TPA: methyltransferase domain-containing protein [Candidatus Nitrosotalea sp.]|nr:methyltransferase domain-containing protein [Nitrososphaerota archaeon]HKU32916.1 methyltransferase domain-containing protein [Candidatus Nitrosotalea sp.]
MPGFDPTEYKISSRANWNTVAPDYHYNWANEHVGPFKSTIEAVRLAEISPSDKVLDIACGTGVVSKEISRRLDETGLLVGVDLSRTALTIAKQSVNKDNTNFFEMDAENMAFRFTFDKILCQYGIMFFPNVRKVLETARKILSIRGKIVLVVHGTAEDVPYFSAIMKPILKYIPDIRPSGAPNVHRFGNPADLEKELESAGFANISASRRVFSYEAGSFEEYWQDYMHSTANSIRPKIENAGSDIMSSIKNESKENVSPYLKDDKITFPWTIFIVSAS